jgi:hypothetical protein
MTDDSSPRELTAVVDEFIVEIEGVLRLTRESLGPDGSERHGAM